jgi:hypothetical protein
MEPPNKTMKPAFCPWRRTLRVINIVVEPGVMVKARTTATKVNI